MSRNAVKIESLPELKAALENAASGTREGAEQAVAEEVEAIEADARRLAPKKTGALRRGIRGDAHELKGEVKSTVRYAEFVEHGTYRDAAQPYMAPAAALARRRLPERARRIIKIFLEGR